MGEKKAWSDPELMLEQWQRYETITMHFNDLLMRFRTQALGGLATVATLAGLLGKDGKAANAELPVFFFVLLIFWVAAWQLDQRYYSRLLAGAVAELKKFEKATTENDRRRIGLSTTIERIAGGRARSKSVVFWFYGLITSGLVILIVATSAQAVVARRTETPASIALPVTFTVDALSKAPDASVAPVRASGPVLMPP